MHGSPFHAFLKLKPETTTYDAIMNSTSNSSFLSRGLVVAALAASQLAIAPTGEAFSVSATRATKFSSVSQSPSPKRKSSMVSFGSLRDLLESSSGDDNDENKPVDDINTRGINFSRSKYSDTKSRSRNSLMNDRLSTFSFSSKTPKSMSEGGGLSSDELKMVEVPYSEEEEDVSDDDIESSPNSLDDYTTENKVNEGRYNDNDDFLDGHNNMGGISYSKQTLFPNRQKDKISDENDQLGLHKDRLSTFSFSGNQPMVKQQSSQPSPEEEEDVTADAEDDTTNLPVARNIDSDDQSFAVDSPASRPDNMGGINYSRRKSFPDRQKGKISDEEDQLGLHKDRLSTFSFSANQPVVKKSQPSPGEDEDDAADAEDESNLPVARNIDNDDPSFGVDNFHNNIDINMSKTASPTSRPDPNAIPDGQTNHADRLSTFSLSAKEEKEDQPVDAPSSTGFGGSLPRDNSNQVDRRLGTFSFASADPKSGSSTGKGTSYSSPLPSASDSNSQPPRSITQSKQRTNTSKDSKITKQPVSPHEVYSAASPQKGSLSSIASSVSIKSRNDRIEEIKARNDPKLLHPDGMNTPRLNSKGDVMSFSSTKGVPNIFQRIEKTNQGNVEDGLSKGGKGMNDNFLSKGGGGIEKGNDSSLKESTNDNESIRDKLEDGDCFMGFDLGTSGARMSIVEKKLSNSDANKWEYEEVFTSALAWDDNMKYDDANDWRAAIDTLLLRAQGPGLLKVKAICVSGTSATCLLVNRHSLDVSREARMYNYDIFSSPWDYDNGESPAEWVMEVIDQYVPEKHTARATTGSLAKLLLWIEEESLVDDEGEVKEVLCHQSDYVSMSLMNEGLKDKEKCTVTSDWHNCLKLGYDVQRREFPTWMHTLLKEGADIPDPESILPSKVVSPGEPFGVISPSVASKYGLSSNVMLVGGTTDSNAAFFAAAGAKPEVGTAVTSLGSTLAMKQLSKTFVEDASRGVYSHRFPRFGAGGEDDEEDAWLVGGASNVGCAILRQEGFSNEELAQLSAEIDPDSDSPLSYYPLTKKGERFPVADSAKEPVLTPKPDSRKEYLHGILQGIGDVERDGFRILGELGASPNRPNVVLSCGGGSKNDMWISMRERRLKDICEEGQHVEVKRASNTEASYGAALLAAASFED